jgi:uncharacterized protein with PIN domain
MRFFVDQTLGRLTKWLRLLGFDVVQTRLTPQEWRHLPTLKQDTYILTRQTSLPAKIPRPDLIVLTSDRTEAQLTEICRRLQISPETWEPLNRCSDCNHILVPVTPEQAEGRVPEYISQKHQQFFECPQCRRLFWEGSHQRRIRRQLQDLQNRINTF